MAVVGRRWQAVAMPLPRDAASVFDRKNTPLMRLIDVTDPRSLEGSSPCEGWSGLDVVQHLIDTQRDFLLKAGADLPDPAPTVAALGPATAWRTHAEAVARQLADDTPAEPAYGTPFGTSTVGAAFDQFFGFDLIVHRWDIGRAAGVPVDFSERELEQVETAIAGFGEHIRGEGVCGPAVEVGTDASRQDRALALTGRDPR
ncbi:maleylpyruvate isomerase family mycothiol-dependent enzyme [Janibacter limosus]|uniref:maleylpyruvate isomerase family mycothiol-dependent enzyme n=1 Tax=Janibacter limosus TaxID=53458 RepID=UPI0035D66BB5|nr:maleylpyruvate isomerase family mycothiol-dependent enzyme [Janibacter limosus]